MGSQGRKDRLQDYCKRNTICSARPIILQSTTCTFCHKSNNLDSVTHIWLLVSWSLIGQLMLGNADWTTIKQQDWEDIVLLHSRLSLPPGGLLKCNSSEFMHQSPCTGFMECAQAASSDVTWFMCLLGLKRTETGKKKKTKHRCWILMSKTDTWIKNSLVLWHQFFFLNIFLSQRPLWV